jgi:hypothetical protein
MFIVCNKGKERNLVVTKGIVKRRWKKLGKGRNDHTDIELVLRAVNVVVNNDRDTRQILREEAEAEFRRFWTRHKDVVGRNRLLAMFCPQVSLYCPGPLNGDPNPDSAFYLIVFRSLRTVPWCGSGSYPNSQRTGSMKIIVETLSAQFYIFYSFHPFISYS